MSSYFNDPMWWVSQGFAFLALIFFVWGWQIKNKTKMMVLIGLASTALAASAPFLGNYSLAVLFGLAAIRNFVFAYLDWRVSKEKHVAKWLPYFFAVIFAVSTITATVLFVTIWRSVIMAVWLELLICVTLLGLIVGNILKGTNLMRVSFVANRVFNIINHIYFANVIAVVIASLSIGSNIVFYIRQLIAWAKKPKEEDDEDVIAE